jgi:acyl carrier protein
MDIDTQVYQFIAGFLRLPLEKVGPDKLLLELVNESFLLIQMIVELQEHLHIRLMQDDLLQVKSVADLIAVVKAKQTVAP